MRVATQAEREAIREELDVRQWRSANDHKWYWNAKNKGNREIEAASSQGYEDQRDCTKNLWRVTGWEPDVIVDEG